MDIIDKVQVAGVVYSISIPEGLTDEQKATIRANIGAGSENNEVNFSVDGQTLVLTKGVTNG